jgi:hypothetical protein
MVARRSLGIACLACATSWTVACHSDPVVPSSQEPMLYVILTPDSLQGFQTDLRALLALTGTPEEVTYLTADHFIMRRSSDGARFDWQEDVTPRHDYIPFGGNYVLAESASVRGLGRRDLAAGETYSVDVSVNGRSIAGSVTIPPLAAPVIVERSNGIRVVQWPRLTAAGRYMLEVETDIMHSQSTTDTQYVLREDVPPEFLSPKAYFRITAFDTNWVRYQNDRSLVRAGIVGAYGLFGASSSVSVEIPRRR